MTLFEDPAISENDRKSMRHSFSAGEEEHHHHHHHHHHHMSPTRSHEPISPWFTTSATPMTTHPHFERHSPPRRGHRRLRSKSLGAEQEAYDNNGDVAADFQSLLVPSLSTHREHQQTSSQLIIRTDSESSIGGDSSVSCDSRLENGKTAAKLQENITNPFWISIMYGLINATIVLPVLMSFGAIIYRDQAFAPYMPVLIKLTLVSGIVHQLCFSTFSSLPFAVGQVQDAGLIFLSSMASFMVQYCKEYDDETMLATVTIGLSLCTALLGFGLILVGYLKLAQYVQMLPTCVIGGYLAYIGWFCGVSGVGLMAGSSEITLRIVSQKIGLVLPGVLGGVFIYAAVSKLKHMAVLPSCILFLLLLFYLTLYLTGSTVEDVTDQGWIRKMDPPPPVYRTWDYLRFDKVVWSALPKLALTELSMIFVVALSSSLDVAAIELELGRPLDYNHELSMVGISNLVSGCTGGYTGSYIFSQSIFSLRAGINSRLAGYVLALSQIVVVVLPFPILAYVPNFFFGSLLSMICVDLMYEWLWDVRTRVTLVEYVICLTTFGLIQLLGIEYGILAGVVAYVLCQKGLGLDFGECKFATREDDEKEDHMNSNKNVKESGFQEGSSSAQQYGSI